ncbi:hypothetical protein ACVW0K_007405 [Streptomyces filamentosus]
MNVLASILRTVVPLLAGWILTVTGAVGVKVDSVAVAGGVTAALTLTYYIVFRILELLAARIGWEPLRLAAGLALGWARPPAYQAFAKPGQVVIQFQGSPDLEKFRETFTKLNRRTDTP